MKSCPTCSAQVAPQANFCPQCGHGFGKSNPPTTQEDESPLEGDPTTIAAQTERDPNQRTRAIGDGVGSPAAATPPPPPIPAAAIPTTPVDVLGADEQKTTVMTELETTDDSAIPNFMRTEPVRPEEEPTRVHAENDEPTRVQTEPDAYPPVDGSAQAKQQNATLAQTTRVQSPEPVVASPTNTAGPTKWTLLALLATLFTAVAGVAVVRLAETGAPSVPPPPPANQPSEVGLEGDSKTAVVAAPAPPAPSSSAPTVKEASGRVESPPPERAFAPTGRGNGPWM